MVLKSEIPDRETIIGNITKAECETKAAFHDVSPNYVLIKDYIIRIYDYLASAL